MPRPKKPRDIKVRRLKEGDEVWLRAKVTKTGIKPSDSAIEHVAVRIDGFSTPVTIKFERLLTAGTDCPKFRSYRMGIGPADVGETQMTKITDKAIRDYLGHNGVECRVRISRDGTVTRHGSPDPFDRSNDYWMLMGTREEIAEEIASSTEWAE